MQTAQNNYKHITHQILSLHLPLNAETLHMSDSRFCQLWQMLAAHAFSFCKGQVLACNGCKRMNSLQTFLLATNGILEGENPTKWRKVRISSWNLSQIHQFLLLIGRKNLKASPILKPLPSSLSIFSPFKCCGTLLSDMLKSRTWSS